MKFYYGLMVAFPLFFGGSMNTDNIHWLGHSSFRIEDGLAQIYIDPFKLPTKTPKADIIFITHGYSSQLAKWLCEKDAWPAA